MKGSEGRLQVGGVGLEIVESASDAGLELGGVLARWARGRDLVEGAHDCWLTRGVLELEFEIVKLASSGRNFLGSKTVSESWV